MADVKKFLAKIGTVYMNLSIRYKILLFSYSIILFISIVLGTYSYIISSRNIQNNVAVVNLRDLKQISYNIDFLQKDINDLSTFIGLNPAVQSFIYARKTDKTQSQLANNSLEPLNNLLASKDYISFIIIYNNNGDAYYISSDGSTGIKSYKSVQKSEIYKNAYSLKGAPVWLNLNDTNQIFILDNKFPKIAMVRTLLDYNTYQESGFMVICINQSVLKNIYSGGTKTPGSGIIILDENQKIISASYFKNTAELNNDVSAVLPYTKYANGNNIIKIHGEKYLAAYDTIEQSKWKIISLVPINELLKNLNSIMIMTLGVILACLVIAFVITMYTSSILTSPIKKLLNSMQRVKNGNFKEKVDFKYTDEIGLLGTEYNDMIENINNLIKRVYKLQIKEREAELKALQAQINPHFLYNTLDAIFWKSMKSKQTDVSDMIYALSRLFRITLNHGNEFIRVRDEREFIEHYLLLQSSRFRDKLSYEIDMEETILDFSIPKLIIQPFVENSIIHGMEANHSECFVKVTGKRLNDRILFMIKDNGSGMSQADIDMLLANVSAEAKSISKFKGYAIGNVSQRLALYYDNDFELNISSEIGKGTKVALTIPVLRQDRG